MTHFDIVVCCQYNKFLPGCLNSIFDQDYPDFSTHVCIDPYNNAPLMPLTIKRTTHDISIHFNSTQKFALENLTTLIENPAIKDDSVIVILDGDDTFADNTVLTRINEIYQAHSPWLTYGGLMTNARRDVYRKVANIRDTRNFRKKDQWAFHLCTFKKWLFMKIDKNSFKDENGKFYSVPYDRFIMYPMVEMAGPHRIYHTQIPTYMYNTSNTNSDLKVRGEMQKLNSDMVRGREPCPQIP
jgi:predicted DCC family thiol-disulfide oxidoreductase YuxK